MRRNHTHYDAREEKILRNSGLLSIVASTPSARFDSEEDASVFFARELDFIKAETYDVKYPAFTAFDLFPKSQGADPGAESVTYYTYDKVGSAKVISSYSTDLPRADVNGKPTTVQIKSLGSSYGYSAQEMRASRYANKSLDLQKAKSAHWQIDRLINQIAWRGDDESGLMGVLSEGQNIPLYPISTVTLDDGTVSTKWKDKTADQILDDINGMVAYTAHITKSVETPDTLVLPNDVYIDVMTRRVPNTQAITILKFIEENSPFIKHVVKAPELASNRTDTNPYALEDNEDGTNDGAAVAFLFSNDKEKLTLEIPMPYYQHPLQIRNLETVINCEARIAGVIVYYPFSALIAVGV